MINLKFYQPSINITLPVNMVGPGHFTPPLKKENEARYKYGWEHLYQLADNIKEIKGYKMSYNVHLSMENVTVCPMSFLISILYALLNVMTVKEVSKYVRFTNTAFCKVDIKSVEIMWNTLLAREKAKNKVGLNIFKAAIKNPQ